MFKILKTFIVLGAVALSTMSLSARNLMLPDSVTVSGQIRGYQPDSVVAAMIISVKDVVVHKSGKCVIPINADGTFSRTFLLPHAQTATVRIYPHNSFGLYLEPGSDVWIEVEDSVLTRNRWVGRSIGKYIDFGGTLGTVNSELEAAPEFEGVWTDQIEGNVSPQQVKDSVFHVYNRDKAEMERYISTLPANSKAPSLLRSSLLAQSVRSLYDYADFNKSHGLLPQEYYRDFTQALMSCDSTLLMTDDAYMVLNRLGFARFLPSKRFSVDIAKLQQAVDFLDSRGEGSASGDRQQIYARLFTPQELDQLYSKLDLINGAPVQDVTVDDALWINDALFSAADRVGLRKELKQRLDPSLNVAKRIELKNYKKVEAKDADFVRSFCGLKELPAVWDYAISSRDWKDIFEADTFNLAGRGITDATLCARLTAMHDDMLSGRGDDLSNSPAWAYLQQLIEPYRGKYLFVDFWELYCGPCRQSIESSFDFREKYKDSPDFAFLYIASDGGSHPVGWKEYSNKYMPNTPSLRLQEFRVDMLGELLGFTAIPFGVIFDREGNVVQSNAVMWEFMNFLREKDLIPQQ
ncbi:MAG: TlpA family protein disulfide reductase [Muribaculaceae bacterium]|nr:TlpA family protein disulfide reductase [Muribaculaceae bacterium]